MKAGDIVFVRGKSIVSSAVRLFDKGEFSHVGVAVSPTHIIEAEWSTKVRIAPMDYKDYEVVPLPLSDSQRDEIVHAAIQMVGKWYDFLSVIGIILDRKNLNAPNALICSELVGELLVQIGFWKEVLFFKPNELYRYIQEQSNAVLA